MKLKQISAVVLSVLSLGTAGAATTALGTASIGVPLSFGGYSTPGSFLDYFTFTLPANGGSGYSVSNFTLVPGYNTVFTNFNLVSNPDGVIGTTDDTVVATTTSIGASTMGLTFGANAGGKYYLSVIGLANGASGGIYNGAISVTAVPEPTTYAMMLAGIGAVGFLAVRRRNGKA